MVMFLPNRPRKMKSGFPLMKNVFTSLAESVLLPLGLMTEENSEEKLWMRYEYTDNHENT